MSRPFGRRCGEPGLQLRKNNPHCLTLLTLLKSLANAQDRRHLMGYRARQALGNQIVVLLEDVAAFRMSDNHVGYTETFQHGAETSPVNAPLLSKWTFCAPSRIDEPANACETAGIVTNGGATRTSRSAARAALSRSSCALSAAINVLPSSGVRFIFQFPAKSFLRIIWRSSVS